jgi:hypothetical protein
VIENLAMENVVIENVVNQKLVTKKCGNWKLATENVVIEIWWLKTCGDQILWW